MSASEEFLDKKGTAGFLGVSINTVDRAMADGELEYVKIGTVVRIPRAALDDYIARHTVRRPSQPVPVGRRGRKAAK